MWLSGIIEQDVGGLHVPVDHTVAVSVVQRFGCEGEQFGGLGKA